MYQPIGGVRARPLSLAAQPAAASAAATSRAVVLGGMVLLGRQPARSYVCTGWLASRLQFLNCTPRSGHRDVIYPSAPVHATLAQPAAGADAMEDLPAKRALKKFQPPRAIS